MSVKNFKVELPAGEETTPFIYRTDDNDGLTWREAKKLLRKWYLDQASSLRTFTEKEFTKQEQTLLGNDTVEAKVEPSNESLSSTV